MKKFLSNFSNFLIENNQSLFEYGLFEQSYEEQNYPEEKLKTISLEQWKNLVGNRDFPMIKHYLEVGKPDQKIIDQLLITSIVRNSQFEMVELLLKAGGNPNVLFPESKRTLIMACIPPEYGGKRRLLSDRKKLIDLFLEYGADMNFDFNKKPINPLRLAIVHDMFDEAEKFVNKGAKVNNGENLLYSFMYAKKPSEYTKLLELLYLKKIDPNNIHGHEEDWFGAPLSHAIRTNDFLAEFMIKKGGVNLEARDPFDKLTPLHVAAISNKPNLVKLLKEAGADLSAITPKKLTALDIAKNKNYEEVVKILEA